MSLAAKLPYDHRHAGGFPGLGSQRLPTDSDCLAYLAAVAAADGAGVEVGVATAVDEFFRGLKATPGLFDAIKASCILCGARTITGALVPLAGDAPTSNGFVSGDYSRTDGITGDGTSYINSGRANNADPQNDKHIAVYLTGNFDIGTFPIGDSTNVGRSDIFFGDPNTFVRINGSGGIASFANPTSGLIAGTRGESDSFNAIVSGIIANQAGTSEASSSNSITVFARNNNGVVDGNTTSTLAFYSIGTDIGSAGLAALDTAVTNLITAIGEAL